MRGQAAVKTVVRQAARQAVGGRPAVVAADIVAAMNLLTRVADPDVHLWTPKERVSTILEERFRCRKQTENRAAGAGKGTGLPAWLQRIRATRLVPTMEA